MTYSAEQADDDWTEYGRNHPERHMSPKVSFAGVYDLFLPYPKGYPTAYGSYSRRRYWRSEQMQANAASYDHFRLKPEYRFQERHCSVFLATESVNAYLKVCEQVGAWG